MVLEERTTTALSAAIQVLVLGARQLCVRPTELDLAFHSRGVVPRCGPRSTSGTMCRPETEGSTAISSGPI